MEDGHIPDCAEYNNIDYIFPLDEQHILLVGERSEIMSPVKGRLRVVMHSLKVVVIGDKPFFFVNDQLLSWRDYLCYRNGQSYIALRTK